MTHSLTALLPKDAYFLKVQRKMQLMSSYLEFVFVSPVYTDSEEEECNHWGRDSVCVLLTVFLDKQTWNKVRWRSHTGNNDSLRKHALS